MRPVVLLPNWYVETVGGWRKCGFCVQNRDMLAGFIRREPAFLSPERIALVNAKLSAHVREQTT